MLDGERVAARFREVEVEVRAGRPAGAHPDLVVDHLRGRRRRRARPDAQARAGPRAAGPGARPTRPCRPLGRDPTRPRSCSGAIAAAVQRLLAHDPVVRLDAGHVGVHQAGSAPGGCAATCARSGRWSTTRGPRSSASELKGLADALGAVRDADVLGIRLRAGGRRPRPRPTPPQADAPAAPTSAASAGTRLGRLSSVHRQRRATSRCSTASSSGRTRPLLTEAADAPAAEVLAELVGRSRGASCARRPRPLGADPTDEELHRVRIRAKRARYAAEAAARAIPTAAPTPRPSPRLQGVLGEQHDAVVAEAWLRDTVVAGVSRPRRWSPGC